MGIDGMDPAITERMMGAGELPHFERLAKSGSYSRLATINPPQSPVVWASIATGTAPAEHGIFDFIHRDPATYKPYLSLHRMEWGKYVNPVLGATFWERAGKAGVPATILKWPMGFPPRPFDNGRLLAGLGTPDMRGMLGTYTFFTTIPEAITAGHKGRIVPVAGCNRKIRTEIAGPFVPSLSGRKEARFPLSIDLSDDEATLHIGRQSHKLSVGAWSPWIRVNFDIGFFRTATGLCRFYLKSIKPDFQLYMTPVQVDYESSEFPITTPPSYAAELRDAIGPYATLGMAEDTAALNDGVLDDDEFVSLCDSVMQEREAMFFHELSRFRTGLLGCVFDTTDRIQHMFWRMRDTSHPMYDSASAERYGDVIPRYYRWMDRILGTVLNQVPDTKILVCSDHGFTTFRRSVHLNTWLVENGFMALKRGATACEGLFESVDWARTQAYAVGFTSIYLNLKGREHGGVVTADSAAAVKHALADTLMQVKDKAAPVVRELHDTATLAQRGGPDLVVGYAPGYRGSWQTAVGGIPTGPFIEDNLKKWSGDHCCDATAVPGVFFSGDRSEAPSNVMDMQGWIAKAAGTSW